mgnify:CR=1 FL=1
MTHVYLCHPRRTAVGRFGGTLSSVRPDDMAATIFKAVLAEAPDLDPAAIEEVFMGCANQAGEDNRNVARMSALLAGLPTSVPGTTMNRLCGSGMDAVGTAFRAIKAGEMDLALAGGVESMSRAPYVLGKAESAFSRGQKIEDTTIGWRFVNPLMKKLHDTHSMPETAAVQHLSGGPGCLRPALPAEGRHRATGRAVRPGDHRHRDPAPQAGTADLRPGRAPARNDAGEAGGAADAVPR